MISYRAGRYQEAVWGFMVAFMLCQLSPSERQESPFPSLWLCDQWSTDSHTKEKKKRIFKHQYIIVKLIVNYIK